MDQLHEQTSFIITTNKNPKEWTEMLGDEVLAAALLDRLRRYIKNQFLEVHPGRDKSYPMPTGSQGRSPEPCSHTT
nr:ATP-binding protein [Prosthecochloris sp. ZM]